MFTTTEVVNLLCNQQVHKPWREEGFLANINFIGFDEDSNLISYFLKTLLGLNDEERRKFHCSVRGCPTTPMGGRENLSAKMTIKKKSNANTQLYPVAHSCFNQLVLSGYTTLQELREHQLFAINQVAFLLILITQKMKLIHQIVNLILVLFPLTSKLLSIQMS